MIALNKMLGRARGCVFVSAKLVMFVSAQNNCRTCNLNPLKGRYLRRRHSKVLEG